MSNSAVELRYTHRYGGYWWQWGRETFYDERFCLRTWATPEAAREWFLPMLFVWLVTDRIVG